MARPMLLDVTEAVRARGAEGLTERIRQHVQQMQQMQQMRDYSSDAGAPVGKQGAAERPGLEDMQILVCSYADLVDLSDASIAMLSLGAAPVAHQAEMREEQGGRASAEEEKEGQGQGRDSGPRMHGHVASAGIPVLFVPRAYSSLLLEDLTYGVLYGYHDQSLRGRQTQPRTPSPVAHVHDRDHGDPQSRPRASLPHMLHVLRRRYAVPLMLYMT